MEPAFKCPVTLHKDGTYTVTFSVDFGNFTPDDFIIIAHLAKKYQVNTLSVTTSKRISFMDTPADQINPLWDSLQHAFGERLNNANSKVVVCPGQKYCRYAMPGYDSMTIAKEIARLTLDYPMTNLKIGISNCPKNCAITHVRDMSINAKADGWQFAIGGNGGIRPGDAQTVASGLSDEELLHLLRRFHAYVQKHALPNERAIRMIKRIGFEQVKAALLAE